MAGRCSSLPLGRPTLRRVFLLIDSRHGPKSADTEIMDLLDTAAVPSRR